MAATSGASHAVACANCVCAAADCWRSAWLAVTCVSASAFRLA